MCTGALAKDPHTAANTDVFEVTHTSLDWTLDFAARAISGSATLSVRRKGPGEFLVLDCSHVAVASVLVDGACAEYAHDEGASAFGGALCVRMGPAGDNMCVRVDYRTTPRSSALQWLEAHQTADGKLPFLFSQCQAIHARTMLPCQDTPAARFTYDAAVRTAAPMPMLNVVMSADERAVVVEDASTGATAWRFRQTTAVPAYLVAIGAGALREYPVGPRTSVWAEASVGPAAAWEFAPAEDFLAAGEALAGPYVWRRYDVLVLPPSFPYGGMENPCLTFLTPSLLAGDRSLVDVLAHEIAHSWTGNLVRCASWEHFWLNEGFTMYLERRIVAAVCGEAVRQLDAHVGLASLRDAVATFGADSPLTALVPDLSATDPDDAFSTIPYEKGHTLLYVLETLVGKDAFTAFFRAHIQTHAGRAIDSAGFRRSLEAHFASDSAARAALASFDWDAWFHGKGMPPVLPAYSTELAAPPAALAAALLAAADKTAFVQSDVAAAYAALVPAQRVLFIDALGQSPAALPVDALHAACAIATCRNVEILFAWHTFAVRAGASLEPHCADAAVFATRHGRMKYCRPVYRELVRRGGQAAELARATFAAHRAFYHPIAASMIAKDLGVCL